MARNKSMQNVNTRCDTTDKITILKNTKKKKKTNNNNNNKGMKSPQQGLLSDLSIYY